MQTSNLQDLILQCMTGSCYELTTEEAISIAESFDYIMLSWHNSDSDMCGDMSGWYDGSYTERIIRDLCYSAIMTRRPDGYTMLIYAPRHPQKNEAVRTSNALNALSIREMLRFQMTGK